jgi:hypothetical protein
VANQSELINVPKIRQTRYVSMECIVSTALPRETKCLCGEVTSFKFTTTLVEPSYLDESRTPEHEKADAAATCLPGGQSVVQMLSFTFMARPHQVTLIPATVVVGFWEG